jgi:hypothetical protein
MLPENREAGKDADVPGKCRRLRTPGLHPHDIALRSSRRRTESEQCCQALAASGYSAASVAKRHVCQFAAKLVGFSRFGGLLESIRKFEEGRPSVFVRGDSIAQEIGKSAVTAHMPGDGNRIDLRGYVNWNRNIDSLGVR